MTKSKPPRKKECTWNEWNRSLLNPDCPRVANNWWMVTTQGVYPMRELQERGRRDKHPRTHVSGLAVFPGGMGTVVQYQLEELKPPHCRRQSVPRQVPYLSPGRMRVFKNGRRLVFVLLGNWVMIVQWKKIHLCFCFSSCSCLPWMLRIWGDCSGIVMIKTYNFAQKNIKSPCRKKIEFERTGEKRQTWALKKGKKVNNNNNNKRKIRYFKKAAYLNF